MMQRSRCRDPGAVIQVQRSRCRGAEQRCSGGAVELVNSLWCYLQGAVVIEQRRCKVQQRNIGDANLEQLQRGAGAERFC